MTDADLFKLLDNIVSLSLLLLVWQLERKRVAMLDSKLSRYEDMMIDEHKARTQRQSMMGDTEK